MSHTVAEDPDADHQEDLAMVEAVLGGDPSAFRGLVEKYQDRVYTVIYGMLRSREDARDLAQETFVKAYRSLPSHPPTANFRAWLCKIAMHKAIDFTRSHKRKELAGLDESRAIRDEKGEVAEPHHHDDPSRSLERKQLYGQIMDALHELPPDQRQVVLLRELEGLSHREIADILEVPMGTVMSRLYYARKKLQKLLEAAGAGERSAIPSASGGDDPAAAVDGAPRGGDA